LALVGAAQSGPARAQEGGSPGRLEGVAILAPRLTSQHRRVRIYAEPGAREKAPGAAEHPLENVVLYLDSVPGSQMAARPAPPPTMRQSEERFVPHVLPILVGTTVDFPNDDPIYHNVFSLSQAKSFDLGRYARGQARSVTFSKPGIIQVFCHIHADMSAYILVLRTPFFARPDSTGRFLIDGIPPGEYRLVTWHERIRPISQVVRIPPGTVTTIRVSIPLAESPDST
jgi:plastocyanin